MELIYGFIIPQILFNVKHQFPVPVPHIEDFPEPHSVAQCGSSFTAVLLAYSQGLKELMPSVPQIQEPDMYFSVAV